MFTRPHVFQHPYKTSPRFSPFRGRPAGFRILNRIKPCFNLFQGLDYNNARSPQSSPLGSPVRGRARGESDDDAPPTQQLPEFFAADTSPQPPSNVPQPPSPSATTSPRKRYGHKQLTMNSDAIRSFTRLGGGGGPHRRRVLTLSKEKFRQKILARHERLQAQARKNLFLMRHEVAVTMDERDMTDEDHIFVQQLKSLHLDHLYRNDLSQARERMVRAEEDMEQRLRAQEEHDRQAARLREEAEEERGRVEAEARQRQKRRQEEQQRREAQESRRAEEESRRAKEERRLAREARERAERERKFKEERERELRDERQHKLREAWERFLRQERERIAREEQERRTREREEEIRRAAAAEASRKNAVARLFDVYEAKWTELRNNPQLPPIDASELPWPFLGNVQFSTPEHITHEAVQAFIFHPHHPSAAVKSLRERVKVEVLRYHPDKFNTKVLPKVKESQRAIAQEVAGAVTRILTRIMAGLDKET